MLSLVTGASGLLGSHVVELLAERGDEIRAFVNGDAGAPVSQRSNVEIYRGDLRDPQTIRGAVRGVQRVFHCAAKTGPWGPLAEYEAINVRGLATLLDSSLEAGVERFVHVSSVTVHGNDVRGEADETAPYHHEPNPYSQSKVRGEQLLVEAIQNRGAPIVIVRPGWIYGPRDVGSFARFASLINLGKMVVIGSGTNHLPLVYVRDVAEGIVLAAESPRALGKSYVIVNDERVTQRHYLNLIAAELKVAPPTRRVPYRVALTLGLASEIAGRMTRRSTPPPLMRYGVQMLGGENRFVIRRARQDLGFVPKTNVADGVRHSIAWCREMGFVPRRGES